MALAAWFRCSKQCLSHRHFPCPRLSSKWRLTTCVTSSPRSSRCASSVASPAAVDASHELPPPVQELHNALKVLKERAAAYVDVNRLQLAMRSIELRESAVRVAVLQLGHEKLPSSLAQVLVADPLSPAASWEDSLDGDTKSSRFVLLRYGDHPRTSTDHPLYKTLYIPSPMLKANNLELLLGSVDPAMLGSSSVSPEEVLLAPLLKTPASAGGRSTAMVYPVHRTVVYGEGVGDCISIGRATSARPWQESSTRMMKIVLGLSSRCGGIGPYRGYITAVDVELASSAVARLRGSAQNATAYEQDWFSSGMPELLRWLTQGSTVAAGGVKPVVADFIASLLDDADVRVTDHQAAKARELANAAVGDDVKREIRSLLDAWAERAHTELRDELEVAFEGKSWRRLKWWKLLWRIDDVASICLAILHRRWLVEAEKNVIWLAGKTNGAGLSSELPDFSDGSAPARLSAPDGLPEGDDTAKDQPLLPAAWPTDITLARARLSTETVPTLQAFGQTLLLQNISTTTLSFILAALVYASSAGASVYEVGTIAAVGAAWSMRQLQAKWERARRGWESEVREEGRKALKQAAAAVEAVLERGGRPTEPEEDVELRTSARASIDAARRALKQLR